MKKTLIKIAVALVLAAVAPATVVSQPIESEAVESVLTVKPVGGGVQITVNDTESHQFYIYSITGQMIKAVTVLDTVVVDLPQGCYIIKSKQWSKKIVVR